MLDGVVTSKLFWIPYIYGQSGYVVEGTPLIDPNLITTKLPSNYIVTKLNKKGDVREIKYLSEAEFNKIKKKMGI